MKLVLIGINMNVADSAAADVSITFRKSNGTCLLGVVKQSELDHKHVNATQDYGDVINSESPPSMLLQHCGEDSASVLTPKGHVFSPSAQHLRLSHHRSCHTQTHLVPPRL